MNWYKTSQLSGVEIIEEKDHNIHYTNIGHGINSETPNYIWYYLNGDIVSIKQTAKDQSHSKVFSDYNINSSFSGRFESSSGRVTVYRPEQGSAHYRPVPKSILFKLYQKFPEIKQIYIY